MLSFEKYSYIEGKIALTAFFSTICLACLAAMSSLTIVVINLSQTNNFVHKSFLTPGHERLFTAQIFAKEDSAGLKLSRPMRLRYMQPNRRSVSRSDIR